MVFGAELAQVRGAGRVGFPVRAVLAEPRGVESFFLAGLGELLRVPAGQLLLGGGGTVAAGFFDRLLLVLLLRHAVPSVLA